MANPIRITEADLRSAMREPRYWQNGHPERDAFTGWVRGGFGALDPKDGAALSAGGQARRRPLAQPAAGWRGVRLGRRPTRDHPVRELAKIPLGAPDARPGRWSGRARTAAEQ